jgi:hypothetical protein
MVTGMMMMMAMTTLLALNNELAEKLRNLPIGELKFMLS